MAYAVRCESCENYFTKFSNKDANTRCEDCKPRKGNRHRQRVNVVEEFNTRLTNLEEWQERMEVEMELWQTAVQGEILGKVEEVCAEHMENMQPTFGPKLKEIEENLNNKLVVMNSRIRRLAPESVGLDKFNALGEKLDHKLAYMEDVLRKMEKVSGQQAPLGRRKSQKSLKISPDTKILLRESLYNYMTEHIGHQMWFSRKHILDEVWQTIAAYPITGSKLLKDMVSDGLLERKGKRGKSVRYRLKSISVKKKQER